MPAPPHWVRELLFIFRKIHLYGKSKKSTHDNAKQRTARTRLSRGVALAPIEGSDSRSSISFPVRLPVRATGEFENSSRVCSFLATLELSWRHIGAPQHMNCRYAGSRRLSKYLRPLLIINQGTYYNLSKSLTYNYLLL